LKFKDKVVDEEEEGEEEDEEEEDEGKEVFTPS